MQFELGTMLFQLGVFVVLVLLVSKFGSRPILEVMRKREEHIKDQIASAEKSRKEAEALVEEQKKLLEQARTEANEIIQRAKRQKEAEAEQIISEAKVRADQLIDEASKRIQLEQEKALKELRDQVGVLSLQLASKLLEKEVNDSEQSKLVNQYLEQVGRVQ
jgi:F-type H+-transporting ATPase subunit b